jgi:alkanesulfonate monooxygenase SsuD/methylene tetrahydromethanopterin reductase-like flavin-dependent oxidoreductase (luciferase family)
MSADAPAIAFLANVGVSLLQLLELSEAAERSGYAGVWMVEYEYDSVAICQAMATATHRIQTGTCIMRVFTRHPVSVAETAAVIDTLAPGRFAIGLGTGPMKRAAPGARVQRWGLEWDQPAARMREFVQVVRRVLAGGTVGYNGRFFRLADITPDPVPAGGVPIWIAGGGPQMVRVAGAEADGMFVHMASRTMIEEAREAVSAAAREAGRDPGAVELGNLLMVCVDDDADIARAAMRHWLVDFYLCLPGYQELLAREGFADLADTIRASLHQGDTAVAEAAIPDAVLDDFMLAGTPDQCRSRLAEFTSWGVDKPILYPFPARGDWLQGYRTTISTFATTTPSSRLTGRTA